jgi:myo-inositol-1-phosphate synthase
MMSEKSGKYDVLMVVAGAKGAVGSTLAVASALARHKPGLVWDKLTTRNKFSWLGRFAFCGWDTSISELPKELLKHGVVPEKLWKPHIDVLSEAVILSAPPGNMSFGSQVERLKNDLDTFRSRFPNSIPVLINLLPAGVQKDLGHCEGYEQLCAEADPESLPDLTYAAAAVLSGIPVVNFTPNIIEVPAFIHMAEAQGVPICGRDGKTGQTYFKVVLASALKARALKVDGWYSLNILGNADGLNLMDPERACGKLSNKTDLLNDILGYRVGDRYGTSSHKVRIDYYPPRGDSKEAWDVIDIEGLFGLPMSIRIDLQGRDSILAAPLVMDLARWMVALKTAGRKGTVPELGFFFKKPVGENPPLTFEDQLDALNRIENQCKQSGRFPQDSNEQGNGEKT